MKFEMKTKALRFLSDIQTGPFGSQLHKEDYVDDGTPIVTVEHLGNRVFTEQNLPRVSNEDKQRLSKYILKEGDIVFSRVGSVDRCSFVDSQHTGWLFSGRCLRVRPFEEISPLFLYYFFCLESTKKFMRNIAVGATMPSINTKLMGEIEVSYPDKQVQEKIANLLGAIDDKIELNNAINDNLADIIQSVYQNRFSSTRSDVTAGVLADICSYSKDKVPVLDLNNSNYYSTENMQSDKKGAVDAATLPTIAQTTKCRKGDVLISNIRPYFKKIVYCQFDCGCSTDVLCFCPKESALSAFLFSTLYADHFFDFMAAGAKGTKMPRGDKQQIMTYPIYLPSADELAEFNSIAIPALTQMECSRLENTRLTALRDALLPKLMSGEIDVSAVQL